MADANPSGPQINIGSILIKGAPADTRAGRLDREIRLGLDRTLGGAGPAGSPVHAIDRPRLMLQLPPRATETEIAEALGRAIARTLRGERP